jgi:hypothetical protein
MSKARQLADLGNVYDDGALSNRSLIINGDMRIDQRNGGSAITVDGTTKFPVDRFFVEEGSDAVLSAEQVSDAPDGFLTSLKVTVSTADTSLGATQLDVVGQRIEGQNMQHLNWGSSSAKTVTLSFWVKSSLTGTFGGSFWNNAFDRSYPFTYSISSANTWEYKTVTVEGPTSGTFLTTNGRGITIGWSLGAGSTYSGTAGSWQSSGLVNATGSVSVVGTSSATWQITGVQLEVGDLSTATPFEHRSYGDELARCQRYFEIREYNGTTTQVGNGYCNGTDILELNIPFLVAKRSVSDLTLTVTGASNIRTRTTGTNRTPSTIALRAYSTEGSASMQLSSLNGAITDGQAGMLQFVGAGSLQFDSEL